MNTAILPPIGYRVPVGRHWFVQAQRNGGSEIKAAVSNGRVKWLLYDGFFLLPSSGSYLFMLRLAILCVRTYLADLYVLLHAL